MFIACENGHLLDTKKSSCYEHHITGENDAECKICKTLNTQIFEDEKEAFNYIDIVRKYIRIRNEEKEKKIICIYDRNDGIRRISQKEYEDKKFKCGVISKEIADEIDIIHKEYDMKINRAEERLRNARYEIGMEVMLGIKPDEKILEEPEKLTVKRDRIILQILKREDDLFVIYRKLFS